MLLHIVTRRHAVELLEDGGEGGRITESAGVHHLGDVLVLVCQQVRRLFQSQVTDKVVRCLVRQLLHLTVEVYTTDSHLVGNHVHAKVGVVDILVDHVHHALQQLLVGRLHLHLFHLTLLTLVTGVLKAHHLASLSQVDDGAAQDLHVERLHQESIGTRLKTLQTIFVAVLGGEQHHGDMVGVHVCLDARAERVSIHLRHHHIADHHVGHLCQNHGQCLLTVAERFHGVVALQFGAQVFGNLVVILYHHHEQILAVLNLRLLVGILRLHDTFQLMQCLLLLFVHDHLLGFQMSRTQRYGHGELATLAVAVVLHGDGTMVQFHERACKVKTDTRTDIHVVHR